MLSTGHGSKMQKKLLAPDCPTTRAVLMIVTTPPAMKGFRNHSERLKFSGSNNLAARISSSLRCDSRCLAALGVIFIAALQAEKLLGPQICNLKPPRAVMECTATFPWIAKIQFTRSPCITNSSSNTLRTHKSFIARLGLQDFILLHSLSPVACVQQTAPQQETVTCMFSARC